jgi:hypothetical protein
MLLRSIVRVHYVTAAATAGAIVARLIIRPRKRKQWIKQSSLLQSEKYRIGPQLGSESALAKLDFRLSRIFL